MRKLLNTLYVTTPDSYITREGLNIVVLVEHEERFRIPIHNIESVITVGYSGASPAAMQLCCLNNVGVSFIAPSGKLLSRVSGETKGNVVLRRIQYRTADDNVKSLKLAQVFVFGKITNYRSLVQRHCREYGAIGNAEQVIVHLRYQAKQALEAQSAEELRGIEGDAAKTYFEFFNFLIRVNDDKMTISGRSRRPPKDRTNAMLSFCYSLLTHEVQNALELVGLDPYCGFFHTLRPGRASLALDMMEELRAYLADRMVVSLINKRQINSDDFIEQPNNTFILTDQARKTLISNWQKRKKDIIEHPYLNEKIEIGLLPYVQAMLLARFLRGELDGYPVFINR